MTSNKLNVTQAKAVRMAVKHGFTWTGDSFPTYRAAKNAIVALVTRGYLVAQVDEFGVKYTPTQTARDFVTYGVVA